MIKSIIQVNLIKFHIVQCSVLLVNKLYTTALDIYSHKAHDYSQPRKKKASNIKTNVTKNNHII